MTMATLPRTGIANLATTSNAASMNAPSSPSHGVRNFSATGTSANPTSSLTTIPDLNTLFSSHHHSTAASTVSSQHPHQQQQRTVDPIEFLNSHYAAGSEQLLTLQLPLLHEAVSDRLLALDESISQALSRQSETYDKLHRHQVLPQALASVQALQHRILLVQSKAIESEHAVFSITSDMKRLDCAKRHLQRTITTLKRLHMLVHAVEQLRIATNIDTTTPTTVAATTSTTSTQSTFTSPSSSSATGAVTIMEYRGAAQLVDATRLLLEFFEAYTGKVEPMRLLAQKVDDYQNILLHNVRRAFRLKAFGFKKALQLEQPASAAPTAASKPNKDDDEDEEDESQREDEDRASSAASSSSVMPSRSDLDGGVLLLDALGQTTRIQFVHELCLDHLRDYCQQFEPPHPPQLDKPAASTKRVSSFKVVVNPDPATAEKTKNKPKSCLSEMERRFTWFQTVLQDFNSKFPVFPSHWNVQTSMARHFLQLTRDHILALLDGPRQDPDANNAGILLKALQKTIVFEKDMSAWLETKCGAVFATPASVADRSKAATRSEGNATAMSSAAADGAGVPATTPSQVAPLIGIASGAFQDYMNPYIRVEEQSMDEQLVEALEDRTVDTRGERPVFISSTNLFVTIKGGITRCTALTTGKPFFLLYRAFQDSLRKYAQVLDSKLPTPMTTSATVAGLSILGQATSTSSPSAAAAAASATYRVAKGEEVTVCHVISTCEYCADTMEALEDLIRDTMDDEYCARINMMADQEVFHDITAKAIRVLVSGLTLRVEQGLKPMASNINWGAWDAVGEESDYVRTMHEEIEPFVISVRSLLPTSYFRSFCDKFATSFTNLYYDTLIRLKKISEPGTQQLLLDVYNLKTLFLKLPVLEKVDAATSRPVAMTSPTKKPPLGGGSTIAPAIYTKMVQKQFGRIETLLKLVGTPNELLIENFKVQWVGGTSLDFTVVMSLKGLKRPEQVAMLERFGVDPANALKNATTGVTSATIVSERVQALQDQGSTVAAKVNSDLNQMRQKVDDFRKTFRTGTN